MKQLNEKNGPITGELTGYYHGDALWFDEGYHVTYRRLAEKIASEFNPKRILELGCGAGSLAWHLRDILPGTQVVTIDGNPDTAKSPYIKKDDHFVCRTDVEFVLSENGQTQLFDMILSVEHFEHIQPDRFSVFMANILRHAKPGAILVATAANCTYADLPAVHCNIKTKDEWHTYLTGYGMERLDVSVVDGNVPFNFKRENTSELIYRFP